MLTRRKFKMALLAVVAVMTLTAISGIAAHALTTIQDVTEDTPIEVVGHTAEVAADAAQAVSDIAPNPIDPESVSADDENGDHRRKDG